MAAESHKSFGKMTGVNVIVSGAGVLIPQHLSLNQQASKNRYPLALLNALQKTLFTRQND
jgi:hypothetical protein